MPRVSVGLSPGLARAFLAGSNEPAVGSLTRSMPSGGAELEPQSAALRAEDLDPATDETVWFTCEVDERAAPGLARRLLDVDGVRSAYVVAPEGPP